MFYWLWGYGVQRHFQQYSSYIVAVSSIGGGNRSIRRKQQTCHKTLTNFITYCCIELLLFYDLNNICVFGKSFPPPSTIPLIRFQNCSVLTCGIFMLIILSQISFEIYTVKPRHIQIRTDRYFHFECPTIRVNGIN